MDDDDAWRPSVKYPNRLRELREASRLSQRELARRIGMTGPEIHKLEVGDRRMTQEHIDKFCRFFGVSADALLDRPHPQVSQGRKSDLVRLTAAMDRVERMLIEVHRQVHEHFKPSSPQEP